MRKQLRLFDIPPSKPSQLELFEPSHESTCPRGQTSVNERIYAEEWSKHNQRDDEAHYSWLELLMKGNDRYIPFVSDRDSIVAACVVQWLGTNCGSSFIHTCEQEIARLGNVRKPFRRHDWFKLDTKDTGTIKEQIREICLAYITPNTYACNELQNEILNFLLDTLKNGLPSTNKMSRRGESGRMLLRKDVTPAKRDRVVQDVMAAIAETEQEMAQW